MGLGSSFKRDPVIGLGSDQALFSKKVQQKFLASPVAVSSAKLGKKGVGTWLLQLGLMRWGYLGQASGMERPHPSSPPPRGGLEYP